MAKNAYFGTDTGNFGTGTAMYDVLMGLQTKTIKSFSQSGIDLQ